MIEFTIGFVTGAALMYVGRYLFNRFDIAHHSSSVSPLAYYTVPAQGGPYAEGANERVARVQAGEAGDLYEVEGRADDEQAMQVRNEEAAIEGADEWGYDIGGAYDGVREELVARLEERRE